MGAEFAGVGGSPSLQQQEAERALFSIKSHRIEDKPTLRCAGGPARTLEAKQPSL